MYLRTAFYISRSNLPILKAVKLRDERIFARARSYFTFHKIVNFYKMYILFF